MKSTVHPLCEKGIDVQIYMLLRQLQEVDRNHFGAHRRLVSLNKPKNQSGLNILFIYCIHLCTVY